MALLFSVLLLREKYFESSFSGIESCAALASSLPPSLPPSVQLCYLPMTARYFRPISDARSLAGHFRSSPALSCETKSKFSAIEMVSRVKMGGENGNLSACQNRCWMEIDVQQRF